MIRSGVLVRIIVPSIVPVIDDGPDPSVDLVDGAEWAGYGLMPISTRLPSSPADRTDRPLRHPSRSVSSLSERPPTVAGPGAGGERSRPLEEDSVAVRRSGQY